MIKKILGFGRLSETGRLVIKKLATLCLIAISYASIQSIWSAVLVRDDYLIRAMSRLVFGYVDVFTIMNHLTYIGFIILWILILIEKPKTKALISVMVGINILFFVYFLIIINHGTLLGLNSLAYTNLIGLGSQSLIALFYVFS